MILSVKSGFTIILTTPIVSKAPSVTIPITKGLYLEFNVLPFPELLYPDIHSSTNSATRIGR